MSEHIRKSLAGFLEELKTRQQDTEPIREILDEVFDDKTRAHIKGYRKYKKSLIIYVDSSMWSFQVNLLKARLLEQLHHITQDINSVNIKIRMK